MEDPIAMLERMPLRVWRLWRLYEQLEPWRSSDEPGRARPVDTYSGPEGVARKLSRTLGMMAKGART